MADFTSQDLREKCERVKGVLIRALENEGEAEAVEVVFHFMDVFMQMALDVRLLADAVNRERDRQSAEAPVQAPVVQAD